LTPKDDNLKLTAEIAAATEAHRAIAETTVWMMKRLVCFYKGSKMEWDKTSQEQ
jgi:hypothetical protein